jgi:hypothetical protein
MTDSTFFVILVTIVGGIVGIVYVARNLRRNVDGSLDFPIPSIGQILVYLFVVFVISVAIYLISILMLLMTGPIRIF